MTDIEDAYRAGWLRGNATKGCEPDWIDEDWLTYCDAREIQRECAEKAESVAKLSLEDFMPRMGKGAR